MRCALTIFALPLNYSTGNSHTKSTHLHTQNSRTPVISMSWKFSISPLLCASDSYAELIKFVCIQHCWTYTSTTECMNIQKRRSVAVALLQCWWFFPLRKYGTQIRTIECLSVWGVIVGVGWTLLSQLDFHPPIHCGRAYSLELHRIPVRSGRG